MATINEIKAPAAIPGIKSKNRNTSYKPWKSTAKNNPKKL